MTKSSIDEIVNEIATSVDCSGCDNPTTVGHQPCPLIGPYRLKYMEKVKHCHGPL